MKQEREGLGLSRLATICFIACFALIGYFIYLVFKPFFSILVWAGLLVVVFQPGFQWILKHMNGRRTAAAFITCFLILVLIVLPNMIIGVLMTRQAVTLFHNAQERITAAGGETSARLRQIQERPLLRWALSKTHLLSSGEVDVEGAVQQMAGAVSRFMADQGPTLLVSLAERLYQFLMMFITMFFFFRDGPTLANLVKASSPLPDAYESEIVSKFRDISYAVFYGSILTAIVQGASGGLLFWAIGMNSALLWAALIAFSTLIPVVGAFVVWGPVSGYFFLLGDTTRGLLVLLLGGLVVSSIDNVLKPMIIRGRTDMHPMLVFLSVLGGLQVFGMVGVLLGPFFVAVFLSFLNFYRIGFRDSLKQGKSLTW